jgi:hypothetical protein
MTKSSFTEPLYPLLKSLAACRGEKFSRNASVILTNFTPTALLPKATPVSHHIENWWKLACFS